jgi:hypothetical protein
LALPSPNITTTSELATLHARTHAFAIVQDACIDIINQHRERIAILFSSSFLFLSPMHMHAPVQKKKYFFVGFVGAAPRSRCQLSVIEPAHTLDAGTQSQSTPPSAASAAASALDLNFSFRSAIIRSLKHRLVVRERNATRRPGVPGGAVRTEPGWALDYIFNIQYSIFKRELWLCCPGRRAQGAGRGGSTRRDKESSRRDVHVSSDDGQGKAQGEKRIVPPKCVCQIVVQDA